MADTVHSGKAQVKNKQHILPATQCRKPPELTLAIAQLKIRGYAAQLQLPVCRWNFFFCHSLILPLTQN